MNALERLLALEAAVTACETVKLNGNLRTALGLLYEELDNEIKRLVLSHHLPENFSEYLALQKVAIKKLLDNPQVFGG